MLRDLIVAWLVSVMLIPQVAFSQTVTIHPALTKITKEGDQPTGLKVILPWTIRLCGADLYGTYSALEALELKKTDADCALWRDAYPKLKEQIESYKLLETSYKALIENYKTRQVNDDKRITDLVKQLKDEIAEKNKYKYQPTYGWIWAIVGGGVALVATGFAIGFGVAYAKK